MSDVGVNGFGEYNNSGYDREIVVDGRKARYSTSDGSYLGNLFGGRYLGGREIFWDRNGKVEEGKRISQGILKSVAAALDD